MRRIQLIILILPVVLYSSCGNKTPDTKRIPLLEVEGKFLYRDQVQDIIPPNVDKEDSAQIAQGFIRRWVTDVLLYENAKRNVTNKTEIDKLIEDYRKSLIIHQYQQNLIEQRLPKEPSEEEMQAFYNQYGDQLMLDENIIKGILLIVPKNAPKMANVRNWVQSGNNTSLENIEKYSVQNAISYDYFGNKWVSFTEILKKLPLKVEDPSGFVASNRFVETSDSTKHYFLKIIEFKKSGQTEPFDMAKDKISNLLMNKHKAEFISNFENELYNDAIENETVTFFKN